MKYSVTIEAANQEELKKAVLELAATMSNEGEARFTLTQKADEFLTQYQPQTEQQLNQQYQGQQQQQYQQAPQQPQQSMGQVPTQQYQGQPQYQQQSVGQPTQAPTSAVAYTMEQLAVAATQLSDAGRRQDLVNLLGQFGVQALTALPKERYGEFATALRQMGAKI